MKKSDNLVVTIRSISELHRRQGMAEPEHPLISVVNFSDIYQSAASFDHGCVLDFYMIAIKKDFSGKIRYGQRYYDFDEGVMSFIAPGQLCREDSTDRPQAGWMLLVHADFIQGTPLAAAIRNYKFFSYSVHEALYVSKKEEKIMDQILENIAQEYRSNMDGFSQDLILSHITLLLQYADRFYHRQFLTRKPVHNDLLSRLEALLDEHFNNNLPAVLPTVKEVAQRLHVSPDYLSDMLRTHTGQNTSQHIQGKLIEKAKEILSTTDLTIAEIAYHLGFEYPQSFHKIFRRKTNVSPQAFRQSFN